MKAQTRIDAALLHRGLQPLRERWQRQARRIDALSLRERAILFACLVVVVAALLDAVALSPLAERARQRAAAQSQEAAQLSQLREQFVAASQGRADDPVAQLRRQIAIGQGERQRLDEALRRAATLSAQDGLPAVLQRLLAQQPGLTLERLQLLADSPVAPAGAAAPGAAASAANAERPATAGLSWQGMEVQLLGPYADLQRYVQRLERELPGLRWGEIALSRSTPNEPPRLVARVYLLKVQP